MNEYVVRNDYDYDHDYEARRTFCKIWYLMALVLDATVRHIYKYLNKCRNTINNALIIDETWPRTVHILNTTHAINILQSQVVRNISIIRIRNTFLQIVSKSIAVWLPIKRSAIIICAVAKFPATINLNLLWILCRNIFNWKVLK